MKPLPGAVHKYLRLTGVAGKEKIMNFRAEFRGGIRSGPGGKFMSLRSVQYNFMEDPARLFHIVAKKMGIPARGNHIYRDQKATMLIKILGLFTVSDAKGWQMDQGETVTVFNDMCFMAPASLIDKRMFVLADHRRKGIAAKILTELELWTAELSYTKCILETGKKQPEAIELYKKNGYQPIPNYGQYIGVENSFYLDPLSQLINFII